MTNRTQADSVLNQAIVAEALARTSANGQRVDDIALLAQNLSTEATARANADALKVNRAPASDAITLTDAALVPANYTGWAFEVAGGFGATLYGSAPYGA